MRQVRRTPQASPLDGGAGEGIGPFGEGREYRVEVRRFCGFEMELSHANPTSISRELGHTAPVGRRNHEALESVVLALGEENDLRVTVRGVPFQRHSEFRELEAGLVPGKGGWRQERCEPKYGDHSADDPMHGVSLN